MAWTDYKKAYDMVPQSGTDIGEKNPNLGKDHRGKCVVAITNYKSNDAAQLHTKELHLIQRKKN